MSLNILTGMSCPNCGGTIEVTEGSRLARCSYCNAMLAVVSDDAGIRKLMYRMVLDKASAGNAARAWFAAFPKARDLPEKAVITEIFPMYLPFWRLSGTGKAIVCGRAERRDREGHTHTAYHENISESSYLWSAAACQTGDLGISAQPEPDAPLIPYREGEIPVFDTVVSKDEAFDEADSDIRMEAYQKALTGIDSMTFTRTFCIPHDFSLVYYPYWIVRYSYRTLDYFAVLDGVTGSVVSGRAPGDKTYQSAAAGLGAGFGGLAAGISIAYALFSGSEFVIPAVIAGLLLALIFVLAGYWIFRFGSDITEGKLTGGISLSKNAFGHKTVTEVK
jgi:hypothetical protein